MQTLKANHWHVALFIWTRYRLHQLTGVPTSLGQTNTCLILRTLLLYLPLISLLFIALVTWPFLAIFQPPLALFGFTMAAIKFLMGSLYLILGVSALGAVIYGIYLMTNAFSWTSRKLGDKMEQCRNPDNTGFCAVIMKCLADWHDKVCTRYIIEGDRS